MALTEREERALRDIACRLRRDDRVLARKLGGRTLPDLTAEWLIIAPVVSGLLVAVAGDYWHVAGCVPLGVVIAVVAPIVVGVWLSHRH